MTIRDQVSEFHRLIGQPVLDVPQVPPDARVRLRAALVAEEAFELLVAIFPHAGWSRLKAEVSDKIAAEEVAVNLPELADACADLDYVVEGTRLECGINGAPIAAEVHRSNCSKVGAKARSDGKLMKGPNFSPPDIVRCLEQQGWKR